ncbi:MAG: NADH-quinone oxidoreductase subunit NuoK [Candidatus Thermoplasmatota archaeon]|jgi:NADH-quinone oxidoreductase subunit K|nr:NADH-quinone oxidoreductase subunit NuoK [Candidatus Thermoplasmatota archaeon]MCL5988628.1 NADH-quinone oxidoreductase subunit NuoK [Candidatus Thermoplasmatota archaeon]
MDQYVVQLIALALFSIGLYGIMTSKLGLKMLISVEIILNSAILSLVSDSIGAGVNHVSPLVMSLFAIAIAAVESAVGISLLVSIYRKFGKVDISLLREIRW